MPAKTESEETFEHYLNSQNITWRSVPTSDRKQPDYTAQHGEMICVFEVKEFDEPNVKPSGGFNPCPPIEKKIKRAREKFKEHRNRPCSVVLWSSKSILRDTSPMVVLSAAFGKYVDLQHQGTELVAEPPTYRFFGPAALTPTANRTISAIVILAPYRLDQVWLEVWRRLSEKKRRGEVLRPSDQFDLAQQVSDEFVGSRYLYQGTIRVTVLENPYGRIAFPPDLFTGPFDQRWRLESDRFRVCFMGAELTRLKQSGVPFIYL